MAAVTVHDRIAALPALVNGDAALVRRGRFLTTAFLGGDESRHHGSGDLAAVDGRRWSHDVSSYHGGCIMQEIGHFPMSEHPEQFRKYLLPVLDEIRDATR